jgi:ssDNA-binding Zn-finger/Zn-ribbon topoisomerase 1
MKKMECKKCGHEILLRIDDEEKIFMCCGQPTVKVQQIALRQNTGVEIENLMFAEQFSNDVIKIPKRIL